MKDQSISIRLEDHKPDIDNYQALRDSVGWRHLSKAQAEAALKNSLLTVCAYCGDTPVGMARLIGDGAVICYIQDLIVHPDYQGMHIGSLLIEHLIEYARSLQEPGTVMMLDLMCAKGREPFYLKHGFIARPNDNLGPGMIMYLSDSE